MDVINIQLLSEEKALLKDFAKFKNISVSELLRNSALEKVEEEVDLKLYQRALEISENIKEDDLLSFEETAKELGLALDKL